MNSMTRMSRLPVVLGALLILTGAALLTSTDSALAGKPVKPPDGGGTAPQYAVVPLGSLGGVYGGAVAINEAGEVAGASDLVFGPDRTGQRAFLISPETNSNGDLVYNRDDNGDGVNDLMLRLDLDPASDELDSWATDINNLGEVVGVSYEPTGVADEFESHAFLYAGGEMIDLGGLSEIVTSQHAMAGAINDLGQVVGTSYPGSGNFAHAFVLTPVYDSDGLPVWTEMNGRVNNLMVDLNLPVKYSDPYPVGINNLGAIAGNCSVGAFLITPETDTPGVPVYMRDDDGDGINDLMVLLPPLAAGEMTEARAINDLGQIIGSARDSRGKIRLVRWDVLPTGDITVGDLGAVPREEGTWATDINDAGQAVGYGLTSAVGPGKGKTGSRTGFLWQEGTMFTFDEILADAAAWEMPFPAAVIETGVMAGFVGPFGWEEPVLFVPVTATP